MTAAHGARRLPLTAAQHGIWLGQQLAGRGPVYWTAECVELLGEFQPSVLLAAITQALSETASLHVRFGHSASEAWQEAVPVQVSVNELDFSSFQDPWRAALYFMQRDLDTEVDLAAGPLFATAVLRLAPTRHVWYLRVHHIAVDGYSYSLIVQRVAELFGAFETGERGAPHTAPAVTSLLAEEAAYRGSPAFQRDAQFFSERWHSAPEAARELTAHALGRSALRVRGEIAAENVERWQAAAATERVELSAWLIAGSFAWLTQHTGVASHILGIPVTQRLGSAFAQVPFMLMNIVPLPLTLAADTRFGALARSVSRELRATRPHQRYRYEDLKRELGLVGASQRLFGTVVNLMPFQTPARLGSLLAKKHPLSAGPVEDLALGLVPTEQGYRLDLEGNPSIYTAAQLTTLHSDLQAFLSALDAESIVRAPEAPVLTPSVLVGPALEGTVEDVLLRIRACAQHAPDRPALEQPGAETLSYAALVQRTRVLAARLRARGVEPGSRVALLLARGAEAVIAQLAVLWLGAAYVPLDPDSPRVRTQLILDDVEPALLVTTARNAELVQEHAPLLIEQPDFTQEVEVELEPRPTKESAVAYVIYTSGSTGTPNGVLIDRRALSHFVAAAGQCYGVASADRVLQFAPLQFDASVEEIFVTLAHGATLVLRTPQMLESLSAFAAACRSLAISVLDLPTAFWHELVARLDEDVRLPDTVRLVIIGGEAASCERVQRWRRLVSPAVRLLNSYGPTETTVVCSVAELHGSSQLSDPLPIGRPLAGVTLAVLDRQRRPAPLGTDGELCVLGPCLARGYFQREQASAARFVELEVLDHEQRVYLTGDRARITAAGELCYLGRWDDELKISGYRVQPLETEAALLALPAVTDAAVVVVRSAGRSAELHGFWVPRAEGASSHGVRQQLAQRVAGPALPSQLHCVANIPRDANGKIDRRALRASARAASTVPVEASPAERSVLQVFSEVLGRDVSDPSLDFFAAGGHSLLALQAAERLSRSWSRELPLSTVFQHPTAAALARELLRPSAPDLRSQDALSPLLVLAPGHELPLFCVHPADGLSWCYLGLSRHLTSVPLVGLQAPGFTSDEFLDFDATVERYIELMQRQQSNGPYRLLGWSSGGGIAHAIASRLRQRGHQLDLVALLDAYPAEIWRDSPDPTPEDALVSMLDAVDASPVAADGRRYTQEELLSQLQQPGSSLAHVDRTMLERMRDVALHSMHSYRQAHHPRLAGDVLFFRASHGPRAPADVSAWEPYVDGKFDIVEVASSHLGMCQAAALAQIGESLGPRLSSRFDTAPVLLSTLAGRRDEP